jgi:hypothetical protein
MRAHHKKICMDFKEPFSYINNHKGSGAMEGYNRDTLKEKTPSEIERVPVWWWLLDKARTYFQQESLSTGTHSF